MSDYVFTTPDFSGPFRKNAAQILGPLAGRRLSYLEIGVLEGRSGVWMLEHILTHPRSLYVGIDCYTQTKKRAAELVGNARRNLARFGRKAVFHQGSSLLALSKLPVRPTFDIAYIDGDHSALGGALDTCLAWPLLNDGGILAFDDWTHPRFKALPRSVGALLRELPHEVLVENEQLWVRKRTDGSTATPSASCSTRDSGGPSARTSASWSSAGRRTPSQRG